MWTSFGSASAAAATDGDSVFFDWRVRRGRCRRGDWVSVVSDGGDRGNGGGDGDERRVAFALYLCGFVCLVLIFDIVFRRYGDPLAPFWRWLLS